MTAWFASAMAAGLFLPLGCGGPETGGSDEVEVVVDDDLDVDALYEGFDFHAMASAGGLAPSAATRAMHLLHRHAIPNVIEGSVIYGVSVRPEDVERTVELLLEDSQEGQYWYESPAEMRAKVSGRRATESVDPQGR